MRTIVIKKRQPFGEYPLGNFVPARPAVITVKDTGPKAWIVPTVSSEIVREGLHGARIQTVFTGDQDLFVPAVMFPLVPQHELPQLRLCYAEDLVTALRQRGRHHEATCLEATLYDPSALFLFPKGTYRL